MAKHLTLAERDRLAELNARGVSRAQIAEAIGRDRSTVYRELRRNAADDGGYYSGEAQQKAEQRRRKRPLVRRMDRPHISGTVRQGLHNDWSPEQISGRLRDEFPNDRSRHVSSGTIYAWIERDEHRDLWESHLRRRGRRPRPRRADSRRDAARIRNRPKVIEDRARLGDFEGDTILGRQGTGGVVTLVDRKSRLTLLARVDSKEAAHVAHRSRLRLKKLGDDPLESVTIDNGSEFADFTKLEKSFGIRLYFADPGRPYQRGTNENTNGLLRQYFPKGTDFRTISFAELRRVENLINNRPRACLGFRTPNEVFFGDHTTPRCN